MTEIEMHEAATEPVGEVSALVQWAEDARNAYLVAESLSKTSFVPKAMSGKPGEITGAILTGAEIGLQPMSAIRSINVISGTPALSALALRGLVQSRGHEVWLEEASETRVVACGRRAGSDIVQRSEWHIDRAKRLGLTGRDNWKNQPQAMLTARATSEVCRLVAADVLLGLPYSVEELSDTATERKASKPTKVRRAPIEPEAPAIEPPEAEATDVDPPVPAADPEPDWSGVAQPGGGTDD